MTLYSSFTWKLKTPRYEMRFVFNPASMETLSFFLFFFLNIYLFIWLRPVLVAARGIFIAACGIFSCSMQTLSCGMWDLVPWQGIEPRPLQWKCEALTPGPPGNSLQYYSLLVCWWAWGEKHLYGIRTMKILSWTKMATHCGRSQTEKLSLCLEASVPDKHLLLSCKALCI